MTTRRSQTDTRRPGWRLVAAFTAVIGLGIALGQPGQRPRGEETWTALVEVGDELAAGLLSATLAGQPLTARKAYLLAFHQAQDAGDVEHVLAVADRMEAAGDGELADYLRRAAETLVAEVTGGGATSRLPPASG
jgi:hypothetical protein